MALPAPPSTLGPRFAVARRDPDYEGALTTRVHATSDAEVLRIAMGGVAMVLGLVLSRYVFVDGHGEMTAIGMLFAIVWIVATGTMCWRAYNDLHAPVVSHLAHVLDRRAIVAHHNTEDGVHTTVTQQIILELEDGRRLALGGADAVIATLIQDDIGIAYVKGPRLIGFRRLAS